MGHPSSLGERVGDPLGVEMQAITAWDGHSMVENDVIFLLRPFRLEYRHPSRLQWGLCWLTWVWTIKLCVLLVLSLLVMLVVL